MNVRYALACRESPNTNADVFRLALNDRSCLESPDKLKHIGQTKVHRTLAQLVDAQPVSASNAISFQRQSIPHET